jgi:hypothetical protein
LSLSRSNLLAGLLVSATIVSLPQSAAAKCNAPTLSEVLLVVDGEVFGIDNGTSGPSAETYDALREASWKMALVCRERVDPNTGEITQQHVVHFITRDGFPKVAETYLTALVPAQRSYRQASGGWMIQPTPELLRLGLIPELSVAFGLASKIAVGQDGWSASVLAEDLGIVCNVFVGDVAPLREGMSPGVPACSALANG